MWNSSIAIGSFIILPKFPPQVLTTSELVLRASIFLHGQHTTTLGPHGTVASTSAFSEHYGVDHTT